MLYFWPVYSGRMDAAKERQGIHTSINWKDTGRKKNRCEIMVKDKQE